MQSISQSSINPRIQAHQSINSIQRVQNIQSIKLELLGSIEIDSKSAYDGPSHQSGRRDQFALAIHRQLHRHNHNRHSNIPPAILIGDFFSARVSLNLNS